MRPYLNDVVRLIPPRFSQPTFYGLHIVEAVQANEWQLNVTVLNIRKNTVSITVNFLVGSKTFFSDIEA